MIHKQLESLRRVTIDQDRALKDALKREEILKDRHAIQLTKLNSRIDGLQKQISDGDVGHMENRLKMAEDKIFELQRQIDMDKDSELKTATEKQGAIVAAHTDRLNDLENKMFEVQEKALNSQRVIDCEKSINSLQSERSSLHSRVVHLEDGQSWFNGQADKMNENYADLLSNHEVSMREINELKSQVYDRHQPDIQKLFEQKMDHNDDLNRVLEQQHGRDDDNKEYLAKLEGLLSDLDRRVLLLGSEFRDDLDHMKQKSDKKIDFLHKWIVKYVGTALKDETLNETDIGTLRCLVCNHPSKKMDSDTPYVVPDFRNTLGYFHDENIDYSHASPVRESKHNSPPRSRNEALPQHTQEGSRSTSKFAKMRSVPKSNDHFNQYPNINSERDVTEDTYSGPRRIDHPKTIAFYNDMTRQYSQDHFDARAHGASRDYHNMMEKNSTGRPRSAPPKKKGTLLR